MSSQMTIRRHPWLHRGLFALILSSTLLAACGTPAIGGTTTTSSAPSTSGSAATASSPSATASTVASSTANSAAPAPSENASATPSASAAMGSTTTPEGIISAGIPGVPDVYTTLPAPFKTVNGVPGKGNTVRTFQLTYSPPVPPRDQNQYWQYLEKLLNIRLEPTQVPAGNYDEKFAAMIASGDLPDLIFLFPPPGTGKLIQQGAFADLTPYLTGDALQDFPNLAAFPPQVWQNVAVNGKIYGVPRPRFLAQGSMYMRQDWADKVGIAQPTNAEEFYNLMVAFTKNDPDGNGQADTYGLGAYAPNTDWNMAFFNNIFGGANNWRRNADGTLTKDWETEEYKEALAFARRLYEAGVYHPDAATMTNQQAKDNLAAGKFGAYADGLAALPGPNGLRAKTEGVTPSADVVGLVPFGANGNQPTYNLNQGYFGYTAIPATVGKDPERVRELLGILNYLAAPTGSEESLALGGIEGVHYTVAPDGARKRTDLGTTEMGDLTNLTNPPQVLYFPERPEDGPYMQNLIKELLAIGVEDPTLGLYSPTDESKRAELTQLQRDRLASIIQGREPLESWDAFVQDWRSRGGDQIRQEYEQALTGQ